MGDCQSFKELQPITILKKITFLRNDHAVLVEKWMNANHFTCKVLQPQ